MNWQLCIQHANGTIKILRSFNKREVALRYADMLYEAKGYPQLAAYVVRQSAA